MLRSLHLPLILQNFFDFSDFNDQRESQELQESEARPILDIRLGLQGAAPPRRRNGAVKRCFKIGRSE